MPGLSRVVGGIHVTYSDINITCYMYSRMTTEMVEKGGGTEKD